MRFILILNLLLSITFISYSQNQSAFLIEPLTANINLSESSKEKLKNFKTQKTLSYVLMNDINRSLSNGKLLIHLPNEEVIVAKENMRTTIDSSRFTWIGKFQDGQAILIQNNQKLFGEIRIGRNIYEVKYLENNIGVIVKYTDEDLAGLICGTESVSLSKTKTEFNKQVISAKADNSRLVDQPIIKVLVLYTQAAQNTGNNINDVALMASSQFATAAFNSSVTASIEIAGVVPFNLVETNMDQDIYTLRNSAIAQQLRNSYSADLVVLLTNGSYGQYVGKSFRIGPSNDDAYAIVQINNATANQTFIHEVGHLLGCHHEIASDNTPGEFHGYAWESGLFNKYGTIMTVNVSGRTRVMHFSNPNISYSGNPTGNADAFNARVINQNSYVVRDFRSNTASFQAQIIGPGVANGDDVLSFTIDLFNGQPPYTYLWQADYGSGFVTVGYLSSLIISMPHQSNLNLKVNVTDNSNKTATDYSFVQNTFLNGGCNQCPDTFDKQVIEERKNTFYFYPNPAVDYLYINGTRDITKVLVYDQLGAKVIDYNTTFIENESERVSIAHLKKGIYYLALIKGSSTKTYRFLKN